MIHRPSEPIFSRRVLLASTAALAISPRCGLASPWSDESEIESVRVQAKAAGLGEFGVSRNEQYLAIGDAPQNFRGRALEILLGLAKDYLKHFADKGFKVEKPSSRMTLLILSGRASFKAFLGSDPGEAVGGLYDIETNRLMIFDNRGVRADLESERNNTLVLFHEATHQLTFNTGLLDRDSDIPLAIAEGIATYGECRSPNGRTKFGDINRRRLDPLAPLNGTRRLRAILPPIAELVAKDTRLIDDATKQIAYSECWLLIHYLMKTPTRLPQFREYLKAIRARKDDTKRMDDWTAHFGDPAKFDRDLAKYLVKLTT